MTDPQLDVFDVLVLAAATNAARPDEDDEALYEHAEREGKRLNDLLCPECPDPGLCAAERECIG